MIRKLTLFAALAALTIGVAAQTPEGDAPAPNLSHDRILKANSEPQNWLTYSGSFMSQRHSLLTEITPDNVKNLEVKWTFRSTTPDKHEATPLVVDGVMYTIQNPSDVVAMDAATGKVLWTYSHTPAAITRNCCGKLSRGVAVQGNKVFLAAFDAYMIAIDARTGKEVWKTHAAEARDGYAFTSAPLVIKDKVITGSAGGEYGVRGFIAAWDVNSGRELWRFNTVPAPGQPGGESWSGDSWKYGGAPIWVTGSYDPNLNLTYWGTGNPGPDWDGRARLGDNLYSCAVIALNPDTGELKWHYQFSPHNVFDWDSTQVPVLVDGDWNGGPRKMMMWANRNGMFYVLDRTNGQFLKGVPFVKVNWNTGFDAKGRPIMPKDKEPTTQGVLIYPGNQGGTNWYNPSYSPRTGLFYIPSWVDTSTTYLINEAPPEFHDGNGCAEGFSGRFPGGSGPEMPYGAVLAIDPKTGDRKWEYRQSARATDAGVLTTATDLLLSGSQDGSFYALDARSGKELWKVMLVPSSASVAAPGDAPAGGRGGGRGNNFVAQAPGGQRGPGGGTAPGRGGAPGAGGAGGPARGGGQANPCANLARGGGGGGGRGGAAQVPVSVASGPMSFALKGKQYISITAGNVLYTFGLK